MRIEMPLNVIPGVSLGCSPLHVKARSLFTQEALAVQLISQLRSLNGNQCASKYWTMLLKANTHHANFSLGCLVLGPAIRAI